MGYNFKKLTDEEIAQSVKSEDKILINIDGKICQATVEQIVNASSLKDTVTDIKNNLIGAGTQFYTDYVKKTNSLAKSTNTVLASFKVVKKGVYLFLPHYRCTMSVGELFSVCVKDTQSLTYPVYSYPDSVTYLGNSKPHCMNGILICNWESDTTYYIIGYATQAVEIDVDWVDFRCIKAI